MDDLKKISNLKKNPSIKYVIDKLCLSQSMDIEEKEFVLYIAILLIKQYNKDRRYKRSFELAYFIILKYSILFEDWQPLYDFAVNFGFYPISNAIINNKGIVSSISTEILTISAETNFKHNDIIEMREQNILRKNLLSSNEQYISYIAPTSFGKSKIVIDHLKQYINIYKKVAIIVPTKSLLMQSYKNIKKAFTIIHFFMN